MADAHGSGPCDSNIMRVQVPFPALVIYLQHIFAEMSELADEQD